jgi:flagellar assembly protein FliH
MTAQPKYQFDADFGDARAKEVPKITVAAHEAALAEAETRAYNNGMAASEAQARTEAERRSAAALERIADALQQFLASISALERKLTVEAVEVAVAVARKLAPALMSQEPTAEIAQLATRCFTELRHAPHIAIRVNGDIHSQAQELLSKVAAAQGFEGRLIVLGDEGIASGDCRVEWADGGIVRDNATTAALIDEAVARYIAARRDGGLNGNLED